MATIAELTQELNAQPGQRGRFEELFKDGGRERGGWVKRPWGILDSSLPEEIEQRVSELKRDGVGTLGFVAMGGESSIMGPSDPNILNISSTSPRKFKRLIGNRDLKTIRWFVVSKSGSTKETKSNVNYLSALYRHQGLDPTRYIRYVTDPGTEMEKEKSKEGFTVEHRELGDKTTVGGRNTLVNNPTLLAYTWRNPGNLRKMLLALTNAHPFGQETEDPWIKAAVSAAPMIRQARPKVALILPAWLRGRLWVWLEQNPEESLGKNNGGFTVYTTRPQLKMLQKMSDKMWVFIEFRIQGEESMTQPYSHEAKKSEHPVVTIPVTEGNPLFIPQVVSYGWMKFVAVVGALWQINFSDQPPVEAYKKLMRQKKLDLTDAITHAGNAVARDGKLTLIYDGLLPYLNSSQIEQLEKLKSNTGSVSQIYANLLRFTRGVFDAQTLAYYDDVDETIEKTLGFISQEILHQKMNYAAKWGEGTGVLHGLFVNWYSGHPHQIPIHIVASDHEQPEFPYPEGAQILKEGAVAAHLSLVEAKRPSVVLIVQGKLDSHATLVEDFFKEVSQN